MRADNQVEFTLQPNSNATNVTWRMSGKQPLLAKVMTLFMRAATRWLEASLKRAWPT